MKQARRRARIAVVPVSIPLRTNMTPDHRLGSPGVRLTKTPLGHACFKPALLSRSSPPMVSRRLSYFLAGHRGMDSWRSVTLAWGGWLSWGIVELKGRRGWGNRKQWDGALGGTHNSAKRCCRLNAGRLLILVAAVDEAIFSIASFFPRKNGGKVPSPKGAKEHDVAGVREVSGMAPESGRRCI